MLKNFISSLYKKHFRKKELKSSNYGRNYGWYIEYEGTIVGELVEPESLDMFWDSYKIVSINSELDKLLLDVELWQDLKFQFRNKRMAEYAAHPFPNEVFQNIEVGKRLSMRGLYL